MPRRSPNLEAYGGRCKPSCQSATIKLDTELGREKLPNSDDRWKSSDAAWRGPRLQLHRWWPLIRGPVRGKLYNEAVFYSCLWVPLESIRRLCIRVLEASHSIFLQQYSVQLTMRGRTNLGA